MAHLVQRVQMNTLDKAAVWSEYIMFSTIQFLQYLKSYFWVDG